MERGELVGVGSEKRIFQDAEHPERVVSEFRIKLLPEEAESVPLMNALMRIIFPGTIPVVSGVTRSDDGSYLIHTEKVPHDSQQQELQAVLTAHEKGIAHGKSDAHLDAVWKKKDEYREDEQVVAFREKAAAFGIGLDTNGQNFSFSDDGRMKYFEVFPAFIFTRENDVPTPVSRLIFDPEKMRAQLASLPERRCEIAEDIIRKIEQLHEDAMRRLKEARH